MFTRLLRLDWLEFRRSPSWGQSMAVNAMLSFLAVYFLLSALAIGFAGGYLLEEMFPDANVMDKFNGFFIYYLVGDVIMRFMLQKFPSFAVSKYLTLNISKATLTRYLLSKSLISFFNILPLFVIVPFFFTNALGSLGAAEALRWLALLFTLVMLNNYLSFWLDRNMDGHPILVYLILAVVTILIYAEYKGWFMLSDYAAAFVSYFYNSPLLLVPLGLLVGIYSVLFKNLKNNAYLDATPGGGAAALAGGMEFQFLDQFGKVGQWLRLELKLIWRNKKSRNYFYMSLIFLIYPFAFGVDWMDNIYLMIVFGMLMVGAFMLNYGQLLFSWNSSHFDFVITQNLSLYNYLRSKYLLIALSNAFFFVLSTPYLFLRPKIVFVNFVMMFFNAGVISFVYLWFTMNNSKKMSLAQGNVFNQEGISIAHYLIGLPIIAMPYLVFVPFKLMGYENLGLVMLGLVGLIGLVYHERIIKKFMDQFAYKKYFLHNNFTK